MAEVSLQAEVRTGTGKGVARKLRAVGRVPATMYGPGAQPMSLTVDAKDLGHILHSESGINTLIDLHVNGEEHLAMARELSRDPLRGAIIHVDFMLVDRNKPVVVDVPIHVEGESPGIKEGGVLEHHLWQLHIQCRPGDVPERINVDISTLQIGESVHVSDLTPPPGVEILSAGEEIIVSCVVPQVLKLEEEVPAEAAAAEGAEAAPAAAEGEGGGEGGGES